MTGAELKEWRDSHKWSQVQAARYLGTSQPDISRWENDGPPVPQTIAILVMLLQQERNVRAVENFLYKTLVT